MKHGLHDVGSFISLHFLAFCSVARVTISGFIVIIVGATIPSAIADQVTAEFIYRRASHSMHEILE